MSDITKPVAVLNKATDILECLLAHPSGISLGEISTIVNLNKSTVHRILQTFKQTSYVSQDSTSGNYKLGVRFLLYSSFISEFDKKEFMLPFMKDYSEKEGFSTNIAVLENEQSLVISSYVPNTSSSIKLMAKVGYKSNLYCVASGKVFLASYSNDDLEKYLRKHPLEAVTKHTITDKKALEEDIALTQKRGYSLEYMENEETIICFAAPIKDYSGKVVAALANMTLAQSMNNKEIDNIGNKLRNAADKISEALGFINK